MLMRYQYAIPLEKYYIWDEQNPVGASRLVDYYYKNEFFNYFEKQREIYGELVEENPIMQVPASEVEGYIKKHFNVSESYLKQASKYNHPSNSYGFKIETGFGGLYGVIVEKIVKNGNILDIYCRGVAEDVENPLMIITLDYKSDNDYKFLKMQRYRPEESDEVKEIREIIEPLDKKARTFIGLTDGDWKTFPESSFPRVEIDGKKYIKYDLDAFSEIEDNFNWLKDIGVENWTSFKDIEDSLLEIFVSKEDSHCWWFFEYAFIEKDGELYCLDEVGSSTRGNMNWDFHALEIVSKSEDKIVIKSGWELIDITGSAYFNIVKNEKGEWVFDESYYNYGKNDVTPVLDSLYEIYDSTKALAFSHYSGGKVQDWFFKESDINAVIEILKDLEITSAREFNPETDNTNILDFVLYFSKTNEKNNSTASKIYFGEQTVLNLNGWEYVVETTNANDIVNRLNPVIDNLIYENFLKVDGEIESSNEVLNNILKRTKLMEYSCYDAGGGSDWTAIEENVKVLLNILSDLEITSMREYNKDTDEYYIGDFILYFSDVAQKDAPDFAQINFGSQVILFPDQSGYVFESPNIRDVDDRIYHEFNRVILDRRNRDDITADYK